MRTAKRERRTCPLETPREVALYDGREHLGTVSARADGLFIATLPDGSPIGRYEDRESAREAILAARRARSVSEGENDCPSPGVGVGGVR